MNFFQGVWHGCPKCYRDGELKIGRNYETVDEKYQKTLDKEDTLKRHGYNVVTMWECDLNQMLATDPEMKKFFDTHEIATPIDPRDAFYGGRTGPTTLYKKIEEGERIDYVDVCR